MLFELKSGGASTLNATAAIEDTYPLSALQQGMLFNTLLDPGSGVDIEQLRCELFEVLDVAAFKRAWQRVLIRHPILRTSFRWEDVEQPQQEVHASVELPWEEQDWRGVTHADRKKRLADFLASDRRRGVDLAQAPLFRLTLLRYGEAENCFIWTFHHAILEGRSYTLLFQEMFAFYEAFRRGEDTNLPLPRPYRDYIDWLQQQDFGKDEAFWRETLKGFTAPSPLVVDHAPSASADHENRSGDEIIRLSAEITAALRTVAQDNQLTLTTIVQGAWALMLSRYSGESDVLFGVVRAARQSTIEGAQDMIGLFLNTLPLRVHVRSEAALLQWLNEVRMQWMAMRDHEHTPLVNVQECSELPAGTPLFQSTVRFQTSYLDSTWQKQGGSWSNRRFHQSLLMSYPVNLAAYDDDAGLYLRINFDRSRIDVAAVRRMLGHVRTLLEAIAINPHQKVGDLPLLSSGERHQLLVEWNQTQADYPQDRCVDELFEEQARCTPDCVAVVFKEQQLSYRELNERADQLALHLRSLGVGPNVLVGLCVERSLEMMVALLGVLKAGGAYVPLDPTYPPERLIFMLEDAKPLVLLTQDRLRGQLPLHKAEVVCLDALVPLTNHAEDKQSIRSGRNASDLAYVLYTSGSTGRPKGVQISHRAVVNFLSSMKRRPAITAEDTLLAVTTLSFDISVLEMFLPLTTGARIVIASDEVTDGTQLLSLMERCQPSVMQATPATWQLLLETGWRGSPNLKILCGGEAWSSDLAEQLLPRCKSLWNMYGPTETTVWSSASKVEAGQPVLIGPPIANTRFYVLTADRQPAPIGVPGELYIGGDGVARGYLNRPDLTNERFVVDPFDHRGTARFYKTGDLVRYLPGGTIEFLGRMDHQVKVRGFRIELGEIESVLRQHAAVKDAVVVAREDRRTEKQIVAYVIAAENMVPAVGSLRNLLKQQLPAYMVPSHFVFLDSFPLTASGKLDRKALPPPEGKSPESDGSYVAPRTRVEQALADIWGDLLGLKQVGIHDRFFELGGHSLLVMRLITAVRLRFRVNLNVPELFENPTLEHIARLIVGREPTSTRRPGVIQLRGGKTELPIYFFYAGPDELRLAQLMSEGHPVFGIEVPWPLAWRTAAADGQTSALPDMEQLVAPYVALLRTHVNSSGCILAGFSFGGRMAFEAAHQFQRLGGKVEMVLLYDAWAKFTTRYEMTLHKWSQDGGLTKKSWLMACWLFAMAMKRARLHLDRLLHGRGISHIFDEKGDAVPWELVELLYAKIRISYRLRRLDSRGILFQPADREHARSVDRSQGWKDLFARGFEIIPVTGNHVSMVREASHRLSLRKQVNEIFKRHRQHQSESRIDARQSQQTSPRSEPGAAMPVDGPER